MSAALEAPTAALARRARGVRFDALPPDVVAVAEHCLLDWLGVAIAGSREPLVRILRDEAAVDGGAPRATLIGAGGRTSTSWAALVNGAAAHALDYDDTHLAMSGHPSAPVWPALLALAEQTHSPGAAVLAAFVSGVETECRLGLLLGAEHYAAGWHSTATLGCFGAAAACAHLLGLDESRWLHAFGLAGTQAGGVKSVFGTMAKPLHAGRAAANGLLAVRLAARGFTSDPAILESPQGFAATHAGALDAARLAAADGRFLVRDALFKYHAACYLTHAAIEAAVRLREQGRVTAREVERVEVAVPRGHLGVCDVAEPRTGLEGKFSLRATVAMALLGDDTSDPAVFTDARMASADLVSLRDRVIVRVDDALGAAESRVVVELAGGRRARESIDTGRPAVDLERQWERLSRKFFGLAAPVVDERGARALRDLVADVARLDDVGPLLAAAGGRG